MAHEIAAKTETVEEKIKRLEEARAKQRMAHETKTLEYKALALELAERFEREYGPEGIAFAIVMTTEGPFAVKLCEAIVHKTYLATPNMPTGFASPEKVSAYVTPAILYPDIETARRIFRVRPGIADRCAIALSQLFNGEEAGELGK